jgi:hypothetical protein
VSPRNRQALALAAAAVGVAAVGGIAAVLGWLPGGNSAGTPSQGLPVAQAAPGSRIAGTAPPESLSPGETIVDAAKDAPSPPQRCANCGHVASLTYHPRDPKGAVWEITVAFDDGTRLSMRYPTNPGLRVGERVSFSNGRLRRA